MESSNTTRHRIALWVQGPAPCPRRLPPRSQYDGVEALYAGMPSFYDKVDSIISLLHSKDAQTLIFISYRMSFDNSSSAHILYDWTMILARLRSDTGKVQDAPQLRAERVFFGSLGIMHTVSSCNKIDRRTPSIVRDIACITMFRPGFSPQFSPQTLEPKVLSYYCIQMESWGLKCCLGKGKQKEDFPVESGRPQFSSFGTRPQSNEIIFRIGPISSFVTSLTSLRRFGPGCDHPFPWQGGGSRKTSRGSDSQTKSGNPTSAATLRWLLGPFSQSREGR